MIYFNGNDILPRTTYIVYVDQHMSFNIHNDEVHKNVIGNFMYLTRIAYCYEIPTRNHGCAASST